ncbi:GGDEF domain-containing protein [Dehalobacter sp. 14DCB1]|uniref:GGDEF domain-containing protein n=1 Tax=Dehalobacter sp. 14DCB1 TaxID=2070227 RepID=UPI00104E781B|nr:GGDEF domain-containing protein [Dehalobacter sp. 14DCB1]TCX51629.1 GGDEF domain-containing protein [Dehalobacter sp. 14DCB1]
MVRKFDSIKYKPLERKFLFFRWGLLVVALAELIRFQGSSTSLFFVGFFITLLYNLFVSICIFSKDTRAEKLILLSLVLDIPVYTLLMAGNVELLSMMLFFSYFFFVSFHGMRYGIPGLIIAATESVASLFITSFKILDLFISVNIYMFSLLLLAFGFIIVFEVISLLNISQYQFRKAKNQAARDPLTGLPNRLLLEKSFQKAVSNYQRTGQPFSIVIFDIDNFKKINDQKGHVFGDKVLLVLARVLKTNARATDFICRYGGEEFLIIFYGCGLQDACLKADKIREEFALNSYFDKPLTVSAGVCLYQKGCSLNENIEIADKALYAAKTAGKNRTISGSRFGVDLFHKEA